MKILPLTENEVSVVPPIDHFISILKNDINNTYPWILENYIDLVIYEDNTQHEVFEFYDTTICWWNCPFVHVSRIHRAAVCTNSFERYIKSLLENDFYIYLMVDTFYIDKYPTYQNNHFFHDVLIYGYEGNEVLLCDYFNFIHSRRETVKFESLTKGYYGVDLKHDYLLGIILFKNTNPDEVNYFTYHEDFHEGKYDIRKTGYEINVELLKNRLKNFINNSYNISSNEYDFKLGFVNGIQVIEVLIDAIENNKFTHDKPIHTLYYHSYLMLERVKYLGRSSVKMKHLEKAGGEIVKTILQIRNLKLKMILSNNNDDNSIIIEKLKIWYRDYQLFLKRMTRILEYE